MSRLPARSAENPTTAPRHRAFRKIFVFHCLRWRASLAFHLRAVIEAATPAVNLVNEREKERNGMPTKRGLFVAVGLSLLLAGTAVAVSTLTPPRQLGDPLVGLTAAESARFAAGQAVFSREFTAETGLGPFFNNVSCASCHEE